MILEGVKLCNYPPGDQFLFAARCCGGNNNIQGRYDDMGISIFKKV
jgi:hypothetical protein